MIKKCEQPAGGHRLLVLWTGAGRTTGSRSC